MMNIQTHRLSARRFARVLIGVAAIGALAVLSGCATAPPPEAETRLVWPEPPETVRIEFVRSITSDEDLGKEATGSQTILRFLEGEKPDENRIVEPMGLAVSDDGDRLYVSDKAQNAIFVYDFAKKSAFTIGGVEKPLGMPMGLALDAQENIYVVEQAKKGVSVFDRQGKQLRFITDASIVRPTGVAIDTARGKVYVADTSHTDDLDHTVKVFDLQGKFLGKVGKGKGNEYGAFLFPTYLAVAPNGHLFVSDTLNARIQEFDVNGKFVQAIGHRGTAFGQFDMLKGVGMDSFGNIYAVDSGWCNVQIFNSKGQIMLFFSGRGAYPGLMQNPSVLTIDKKNRIYVGDVMNHRVNIYQLVNTTAADSIPKEDAAAKKEPAKADSTPKVEAAAKKGPVKKKVAAKKKSAKKKTVAK